MTLAAARPIAVFGVTIIPQLFTEKQAALSGAARLTHDLGGKVLIALILLHIAGALKHHILDKDGTLKRIVGLRVPPTRVG
jgi:cytochrome b561